MAGQRCLYNFLGQTLCFRPTKYLIEENTYMSHLQLLSYGFVAFRYSSLYPAISIISLNVLGLKIIVNYGPKYFWALWFSGALAGSIAM